MALGRTNWTESDQVESSRTFHDAAKEDPFFRTEFLYIPLTLRKYSTDKLRLCLCSVLMSRTLFDLIHLIAADFLTVDSRFHKLHSSPNIIRVIKSRRMRWVGHVTRTGRSAYRTLVGKPDGKRPLGRHRLWWKAMFEWILEK
jgi:hypothetical protein